MKKLDSKQICLIVAVLCILIFVLFFFFGYQGTQEKTESLLAENSGINAQIAELESYYRNESTYKQQTIEYQEKIAQIVEGFAPGIRPEDALATAVKIKKDSGLEYSDIIIGDDDEMYSVPVEIIQAADMENYQEAISFHQYNVAYNNTLTYPSLKDAIKSIFDCGYVSNISAITYARNESTGLLEGRFEMNYYYVLGNNREYVAPKVSTYNAGISDIFRSGIILEDQQTEQEEVAEEAAETPAVAE